MSIVESEVLDEEHIAAFSAHRVEQYEQASSLHQRSGEALRLGVESLVGKKALDQAHVHFQLAHDYMDAKGTTDDQNLSHRYELVAKAHNSAGKKFQALYDGKGDEATAVQACQRAAESSRKGAEEAYLVDATYHVEAKLGQAPEDPDRAELQDLGMRVELGESPAPYDGTSDDEYKISHRPTPGPAINDMYGEGLDGEVWLDPTHQLYEHPERYTGDGGAVVNESARAIRDARGISDETFVRVYRTAPPTATQLNNGDWVSLSKTYAEGEGLHQMDSAKDQPVWQADAAAKYVRWAGDDLGEFGYFGPPVEWPTDKNLDLIKAEVARQERILSFQRDAGGDRRLFACRVLESARCVAQKAIQNTRGSSDEKEWRLLVKRELDEQYEILTQDTGFPGALEALIARIEQENVVNQEWLSQRKAELEKLREREVEREPTQEIAYSMSR